MAVQTVFCTRHITIKDMDVHTTYGYSCWLTQSDHSDVGISGSHPKSTGYIYSSSITEQSMEEMNTVSARKLGFAWALKVDKKS